MADHLKPTTTSTYANFVTELKGRIDDVAKGLDPANTTPTNVPTDSVRYSSAGKKWEKWNGTAWSDLAAEYAINISGSAPTLKTARTIALSGAATGTATSFNGSANISIPVTALDPTKITGQVPVNKGGTGAATAEDARANLGIDLQKLSTDYAGPTEPATKWAYMTWADTGNMLLKRRNAANTAWVIEGKLLANGSLASEIDYSNTGSGLAADNVQAAIDELAAYKSGEVIQVANYSDAGSSTSSGTFASIQASAFNFTPKSASSTLLVEYWFHGTVGLLASNNTSAAYTITRSGASLDATKKLGIDTGAGGNRLYSPVAMAAKLANSDLATKSFLLYAHSSHAGLAAISATEIFCKITEVAD